MYKRNAISMICVALLAVCLVLVPVLNGARQPQAETNAASSETADWDDRPDPSSPVDENGIADAQPLGTAGSLPPDDSEYVPGVVLVRISDGCSLDQANEQLSNLDYLSTASISAEDVMYGYVELALAEGVDVGDAMSWLSAVDAVEAVQPNYVYTLQDGQAHYGAEDPALQAGDLDLIEQSTSINDEHADKQWALDAVDAYGAWDYSRAETAGQSGHPITVAIIDSGIDMSHEDFESTRIVGAWNFVDAPSGGDDNVADTRGHGTHVAGIVSATVNNGTGVAGVSYNAQIMPVRAVDSEGNTTSKKVAAALEYVVKNADAYNVRVVNISIGTLKDTNGIKDQAMLDAIEHAHEKGLLLVYASGNGGSNGAYRCVPCDFDDDGGAIGVISVDDGTPYTKSDFSNYNMIGQTTKDISAPGGGILSTCIPSQTSGAKALPGSDGKYAYLKGTSMAAPYVSGIAALVFAAYPDATAEGVRGLLCETAQDLGDSGWDRYYGYGLVNAEAALKAAPTSLSLATVTVSPSSYQYDGEAKKPEVTVKDKDGKTLVLDDDYTLSYSNNVGPGTAVVTVKGKGSYSGSIQATFEIIALPKPMYRLYNPNSGEHFFTSSDKERDNVVKAGWRYEGVGWTAPHASDTPVYRLYNEKGGEHHYTKSENERDKLVKLGWKEEGIGWYSDDGKGVQLYRLYNPNAYANNHHYTTSTAERDKLVSLGWQYEGIGWYGMKQG